MHFILKYFEIKLYVTVHLFILHIFYTILIISKGENCLLNDTLTSSQQHVEIVSPTVMV